MEDGSTGLVSLFLTSAIKILAQIQMMFTSLIIVIVLYGGFLALVYVAQRSLQYFPERRRTAPGTIGLPEVEEVLSLIHI